MSTVEVLADVGDRTPLLQSAWLEVPHNGSIIGDEEITSMPPQEEQDRPDSAASTAPKQRLASLDVFRGLTVALMILVDDAGKAFPSINHSPWFGVTLADFVMPFFLFIVGVSASFVFKKVPNKIAATRKILLRSTRLFLLGLLLQGGYFHGRNNLTYGVDIGKIRLMGVLQRIAIGYFLVSVLEIWLVNNIIVDSATTFVHKYWLQLVASLFVVSVYIVLLYSLFIPSWTFGDSSLGIFTFASRYGPGAQTVRCGVRGSLEPPCNAVGLIDRVLLGENHLYPRPVYRRTKECSLSSPDYGPVPPNAPAWCLAPFDPEGILSSLIAAVTCFVGLHFGHIMMHFQGQIRRVFLWSFSSFPLIIVGIILEVLGVPFSKPLYTVSYLLMSAGVSGFLFILIFYIETAFSKLSYIPPPFFSFRHSLVDIKCIRKPTILFEWMGKNALIIYALAACDLFPAALQGFYWRSPENNLVDYSERVLQAVLGSSKWGTLAFVMVEILFWGAVAGFLHMKHVYIKL